MRSGRRKDGFVSFGLRGGKARVPSLELLVRAHRRRRAHARVTGATSTRTPRPTTRLRAIEAPIAEYFACTHDAGAVRHRVRDQPDARARELTTRDLRFRAARGARLLRPGRRGRAVPTLVRRRPLGRRRGRTRSPRRRRRLWRSVPPQGPQTSNRPGKRGRACNILEFGSGAAGPIATRYFVEHGATVLRVESKSRPDFLRVYALGPNNPHGLEGAPMYDGLNVGKRNVTLNLKHPDAVALVRRLVVEWADAVAENFAPRAMRGFGLDYDALAADQARPRDGQRVPERPDRSAPRLSRLRRAGLCARGLQRAHGLARPRARRAERHDHRLARAAIRRDRPRRRRCCTAAAPGRGAYLDVSQVESAIYSLAPWLLDYEVDGDLRLRDGNRHAGRGAARCVPVSPDEDGVRRPLGRDRVSRRRRLGRARGAIGVDDASLATTRGAEPHASTRSRRSSPRGRVTRTRATVAEHVAGRRRRGRTGRRTSATCTTTRNSRRAATSRRHDHPFLGDGLYERNGFRLSRRPVGLRPRRPDARPGHRLGAHRDPGARRLDRRRA